jgi:hypothetical protein
MSLFPEQNNCHEIENLNYFMESSKYNKISNLFTYRLFSCHNQMTKNLQDILSCTECPEENLFNFETYNIQVTKLPFDAIYKENMNEKNAHEVGWAKQRIYMFMNIKKVLTSFDYIFYIDADIKIDANDIYKLCKILERKNKEIIPYIINIPYIIKSKKQVMSDSFGCFILPIKILNNIIDITQNLYEVINDGEKLYRRYAPDWILRKLLLREGCKEIRGDSCNTKHYLNNTNFYEFDSNKITFN